MKTILLIPLLTLFFVMMLNSCQKGIDQGSRPGMVSIYLTDHDAPEIDSLFVEFLSLEIRTDDDSSQNGGWISLAIRPGIYNILRFRNGLDTLFAQGPAPAGTIRKIRITLGSGNSVVSGGQVFPLKLKDQRHQVILDILPSQYEISNQGDIIFRLDFDAGRSIRVDNSGSGNGNGFELDARISAFSDSETGRIEGRVLPLSAEPWITVYSGSDTAMAVPDRDHGKFRIVGLKAGTYTVLIDGRNGYRDSLLTGIVVRKNEDSKLPDVILMQ